MRVDQCIRCQNFPCPDVLHERYSVPAIELDPACVQLVLISECAAALPEDDYYAPGDPLFARTTVQAFNDAGAGVQTLDELLARGIYFTTAVKCGKTGYAIQKSTQAQCSLLLEPELALFPNAVAYLLMGDVAIQALNAIARRNGEKRVIPAVSTYKLRGQSFSYRGRRVFPSYLQAGPSFFIEKSKRKMIAEDLSAALALLKT
jgi:uracil-DNA glycosylase